MTEVAIHPGVLADVSTHILQGIRRRPRQERFGLLFGRVVGGDFWVTAYVPYTGGTRGKDFVEFDEQRLYRRVRRLTDARPSGTFLGLYHSHPLRFYERIPSDLIELAEASLVDRASFTRVHPRLRRAYRLDAIVAVGPARQAPSVTRFPIIRCMPNWIRHKGHTWTFNLLGNREVLLWMPGRVQVAIEPGCCRWTRQFHWFFALRMYARQGRRVVPCRLTVDLELPYAGRWDRTTGPMPQVASTLPGPCEPGDSAEPAGGLG
ncbi:hypothetical protein HRbin11_01920 [bacterium HR11]|nr:hypothetical protein HRbin11_01920 [bacterium HR11]